MNAAHRDADREDEDGRSNDDDTYTSGKEKDEAEEIIDPNEEETFVVDVTNTNVNLHSLIVRLNDGEVEDFLQHPMPPTPLL